MKDEDNLLPLIPLESENVLSNKIHSETSDKSNVILFPVREKEIEPALSRDEFFRMFFEPKFREAMYKKFDDKENEE
jgi:hypothetical protein